MAVDVQMNKMNADLQDFAYPKRWTELASVASSVDFEKVSVQASLLGTFIQESTRSRKLYTASPDKRELSPAVFFSYTPMSDFVITGFFKRIFRMPTFNDLYYTEIGNANLKPERTWQYDLGVAYGLQFGGGFLKSLKFRADGYYNTVTDKIIAYPTGQQFRWTMLNLGKVRIGGVESALVRLRSDPICNIRFRKPMTAPTRRIRSMATRFHTRRATVARWRVASIGMDGS